MLRRHLFTFFFFFNDTATTEIYTLSLHDALPISEALAMGKPIFVLNPIPGQEAANSDFLLEHGAAAKANRLEDLDRKSTRLNSSHLVISYAVFCLKKKKNNNHDRATLQLRSELLH